MKKKFIKMAGYTSLGLILLIVIGLMGCGGNTQDISEEPTEVVAPTEKPTEKVDPTEEPTEEVIPTEEPTEEVIPTEAPTEEVVPTEDISKFPQIFGKYSVVGLDPDYNNYESILEITASDGVFQWNWLDREPVGYGIFQEDVVSVVWNEYIYDCGLMSMTVQEDGILDGIYKEIGSTWVGEFSMIPEGELGEGIEGTFTAVGNNSSGGMFICLGTMTRNGDVYDLLYDCEGTSFYGVGIQRGSFMSVAFSNRKTRSCMVANYLIAEDGTLDGIWASIGSSEVGTDVAVPETSE